jgi:hypothetical protein
MFGCPEKNKKSEKKSRVIEVFKRWEKERREE